MVLGDAGYIGSVLVQLLLGKGYKIRVIYKLMCGGEPIVELLNNPNFEFIKGDILNKKDIKTAFKNINYIAKLTAIVSDPICKAEPKLA